MPVYHRTQRLQIYGEKPEVTQLFNDRYRIVVRCKAARDTEAWYNDNKSQIFADFGTLYNAQMSIDGIDSRTGEAYDNMVLVSNAVGYTQTGEYVVTFVYETLTATWTKEQEDTVSSTDNGLRIVERSEVATIAATAPYDEDNIGTSTITSGGKTLYLAGFKDETKAEADAQIGRVTTQWLEAGTLSETLDNVGSQKAKVIEAIGPDPATPTGYSLASKQESSFNGFQTNRFTFLKDNVELSRTNDYVGSQLAITREFFNPTSDPTETGYSLASKQQSDFEGIKTVKYVFLRNNILLSQSEDQIGSQNAIVEEWFNPSDRDEKTGYSVARREESNIDGIPTERYTFMRDCILRVDTPKVGGSQRVSVQAFDMTEAEVATDLAAVTASHELIDIQESDYEGIKTSTFVFEVNDFEVRSKTENGLQLLTRTELSTGDFTDGDVGTDTYSESGLYLAGEEIDNGNTIKKRVSRWAEAGVTSVSTDEDSITGEVVVNALNLTAAQVRNTVTEVTANHSLKSQSTNDFEGLNSFRYVFEIRSTNTETELGDAQIGVNFYTGIQTDGSSDFIIERQYAISSSNVASSIKKLIPPEINDPVFDGTGGTQKAYIVDQEVKPNGKDGAVLTRTFAMLPTHLDEWDEMVIRFPGVSRGPFQLDEGFVFRSQPYSEAVPVRICRDFFLSNPQRICRPDEFRPVDENGNRVTVLTDNTVPTADEYIGYVNSGKYLNDRVSIHRWQGDIWERRITQFKAE